MSCGLRRSIRRPSRSITQAFRKNERGSTLESARSAPLVAIGRPFSAISSASQTSFESAVPWVNSWPVKRFRTTTSSR